MIFHSGPTSTLKTAMKCHVNGVSRLRRKQGRPQGPQPGSHHHRPQGPGARAPSAAAARARAALPREVTQGHSLPAARSARAFFPSPSSSSAPATRPTLLPHSPREAGSQRRKPRPGTAELGFSSEPVRGGFPHASSTLLHGAAAAAPAASPGPPAPRDRPPPAIRSPSGLPGTAGPPGSAPAQSARWGPRRRASWRRVGSPPGCRELRRASQGGPTTRSRHRHSARTAVPSLHPGWATPPGEKSRRGARLRLQEAQLGLHKLLVMIH